MAWRLIAASAGLVVSAGAAGAADAPVRVHPASALPFVLLLAAVAVLPMVAGHWWHPNRNKGLVAALLGLPVAAYLFTVPGGPAVLWHEVEGYVSFIVLLTALYAISGGIVLRGDLPPTPAVNAGLLLSGAALANLIGTTGASMLLVRPVLRINARRNRRAHVPVFFIFLVGNTGGLLTPLGDPPLFLGFLQGVPFGWTLGLWPQWLLVNGLVLAVFVVWDRLADRGEAPAALSEHETGPEPDVPAHAPLRVEGLWLNGPLLLGVVGVVLFKKHLPFPAGELLMLGLTAASLWKTPRPWREANGFSWGPMAEVAVLFAGIFVAMAPALVLLAERGAGLGVSEPWQFFWLTGVLSSLLDNAPTYLTMAHLAAAVNGCGSIADLPACAPHLLAAVSCGAVFMGANSYIGNGPNFMVKAIAEEAGYPMPSFGRYMLIAGAVLLPVFGLVTLVFFRG
ncbi:MAG: sodium:proton antiporter [Gemmataceae bacterium]|nr:sodium:proton antiporter [Gemmataceae bacterium]